MNSLKEVLDQIDAATYNEAGLELLAVWRRQSQLRTDIEGCVDDKSESLEELEEKDGTNIEFMRGLYFSQDRWIEGFDKEYQIILDRIIELFGLEDLYKAYHDLICNTFSSYAVDAIDFEGLISALKKIARTHFVPALKN